MNTWITAFTLTLPLLVSAGQASAQDRNFREGEWPLGMEIAFQGDQALVGIRSAMTKSIAQSVERLMAVSLPEASLRHDHQAVEPDRKITLLAVLKTAH